MTGEYGNLVGGEQTHMQITPEALGNARLRKYFLKHESCQLHVAVQVISYPM
jgi:hypothetical protein